MRFRNLFDFVTRAGWPARHQPASRRSASCRLAVQALDDRLVPSTVSVSGTSVLEGNAGTRYAVVSVNLDVPANKTVTVNYATANDTARAGSDYGAVSGQLTFAPGETGKTVDVPVYGDRVLEPDETFFVNLRSAKGAKIADGQGVVTILDSTPRVGIYDAVNFGEPTFTFTVVLAAPCDEVVTVNFATADGSAYAGVHYVATSGTLTFAPGETSKTITVDRIDTAVWGTYDSFYVQLTNASANALISYGQAIGFIFGGGNTYPG